ncbi:pyridoxal-dependent decarboxylase domain-containing protein 1 isoform X1 [Myxocyprinus asiaticus]|uniref:pyridoxal-dependent decarboxylase domain-containing protein 1 isoform X1 n=1 Tax=Myxocyprinus asiaticus TaxID=70543 RepID=UPI002221D7CB|nr:pyridoxal-dependent decarboxylase domain-containing protein 1 isoform X1 [Myxocyprinus asiaticus]XP_051572001.1 pyridoxal-dependent decarboxylase domain-containing protein 1 isoform X1 [Myxocyprinus asiaticus]
MMDPALAEMGNHLSDAMKILESGKLETEQVKARRKLSWKDIPGPLQVDGQDVVSILQLVQNLMHGDDDMQGHRRMQYVGEQGHMALLGHSLAAYISVLDRERLRKLTTRILSDTTLWLCRLFKYENGSAYYHEDDREGLLKVCRLVINTQYEDYATEGFTVLSSKQPVIYQSAACRPGLGQHLCSQLGLPLSSLCIVPCNTMFGSLHQMDVALLDKLIKDDQDSGKVPLLLIANAGTPGAGHTDKLSRLKELCVQCNMWLHVEGVNLATLALGQVSSTVTAATKCDSMTLTPGPWLGLPAVPAVTLYRHEDPALSLAAGLTSSQPVEKLRALPLWLSLQYLGHDGILERIRHAAQLSQQLLELLKTLASIKTSDVLESEVSLLEALHMVEDELNSPVVVFRFSQECSAPSSGGSVEEYFAGEREILDALNRWLGEQLAQQVPISGVDVVELEDEGACVRFNPLMTAAVLGTQENDVAALVEKLGEMIPVLSCTLHFRQDFKNEVLQQASLSYIEDLSWPGLGGVRYEPRSTDLDEDKRQQSVEGINSDLLKKLKELDTDLSFSIGPEFCEEKNCIFIGMATEDLDVAELVETIVSLGKDIEESGKLFENMTEVVRKGIQEAEQQLQKANEEKLMEEGVLRQIPLVGSVLNWFSPVQASVKGRTFNLAEGSVDSTEPVYSIKTQMSKDAFPDSPKSSAKRFPGQKLFQRHGAGSDSISDTSSVGQLEESFREAAPIQSAEEDVAEVPQEHSSHADEETVSSDQRLPEGQETESADALR